MPKGTAYGVVAWAVARLPDGCGVRHIAVETDLHHRRKGYARACLRSQAVKARRDLCTLTCWKTRPNKKTV